MDMKYILHLGCYMDIVLEHHALIFGEKGARLLLVSWLRNIFIYNYLVRLW